MALQFLNACFFFIKVWLGYIGNDGTDGHVDSIKLLLNNPEYANHNSEEHLLVRLLRQCRILLYDDVCCHVIRFYICIKVYSFNSRCTN